MSPKRRFLGALLGGRVDRPSVASATSTACIKLMGNVNNPVTLYRGTPDDVRREVEALCRVGIDIIGPECAIPLTTPIANLKAITEAVIEISAGQA